MPLLLCYMIWIFFNAWTWDIKDNAFIRGSINSLQVRTPDVGTKPQPHAPKYLLLRILAVRFKVKITLLWGIIKPLFLPSALRRRLVTLKFHARFGRATMRRCLLHPRSHVLFVEALNIKSCLVVLLRFTYTCVRRSVTIGVLTVAGRIARCRRWPTSWCPACITKKCNGGDLSIRAAATPAHSRRTPASSRARTASACHWSIMTGWWLTLLLIHWLTKISK